MTVRTSSTSPPATGPVVSLAAYAGVPRRVRRNRAIRSWTIAWTGAAAIGVANAVMREAVFGGLDELRAHQVSTVTLLMFLTAYMWAVGRWRELPSSRTAVEAGVLWAGLTVLFEFALGLLVTKQPMSELLGAYDVAAGRMWAVVPLWMAVGPTVLRRLHARRRPAVTGL